MAKTKKATSRKNSTKKKSRKTKTKPRVKTNVKPAVKLSGGPAWLKNTLIEVLSRLDHLKEQLTVIEEYADKQDDVISNLQAALSKGRVTMHDTKTQPTGVDLFDVATEVNEGNGETVITKEEVTQALQEVQAKWGTPKVKEILKDYNAKVVSGIAESEYPNVVAACRSIADAQPSA